MTFSMNTVYGFSVFLMVLITPGVFGQRAEYLVAKDSATINYSKNNVLVAKRYFRQCINMKESKRADLYYLSSCYAKLKHIDSAVFYFSKALDLGLRAANISRIDSDSNIENLMADKRWKELRKRFLKNTEEYGVIQNPTLSAELERRRLQDQRRSELSKDSASWNIQKKIDLDNRVWLDSLISNSGWPTIRMVGEKGALSAWLIVQHADDDVAFQQKCLAIMEKLIKTNEISLSNYAYLMDRVLINTCNEQMYGTQFSMITDHTGKAKTIEFKPIKDSGWVDKRREYMGLKKLEEYRAEALNRYSKQAGTQ